MFDVELIPNLPAIFAELDAVDNAWDLFYLGREKIEEDIGAVGRFVRPGFSYCTYAYALTPKGVHGLLAYNFQKNLMPVDEFLPATYILHPRPDVRSFIKPRLRAYALRQPLVQEGDEVLFGSDTENSPEMLR